VNEFSVVPTVRKPNAAVRGGKKGVVLSAPDVVTGVKLGASLADND
jgi:hypothetical protein